MEAYKIGIAISMTNGVSAVLGVIARDMMGLHVKAEQLQGSFNKVKLAAMGAAGVMVGAAVFRGMGVLVEHGAKLVEQQAELRRLGVTNQEVAEATAASWKAAGDVLGSSVVRNLQLLREAKGAFGTVAEARLLLPDLARADVLMGHNDRGLQMVMKSIEMRGDVRYKPDGELDAEYARKGLNAAIKFFTASGGQVDAQQLKGLITMAGPMAKMMDADAFYRTMLTATEELGQKAGTALSAAGRALYGGIMPQRNSDELVRLGLMDPSKIEVGRGGNVRIAQGALTGFDTLNGPGGLPEWVDKIARPAFHRDYLTQQQRTPGLQESQYDQQELYRALPTETFRRLMGIFLQQAGSVTKGAQNYDAAQGLEGYNTAIDQNPATQMRAFKESWDNLLTSLGAPMVTTAYTALGFVTEKLTGLSQWAASNPGTVAGIEAVTAGLAGLIGAGGVLAIGGAALSALGVLSGPVGLIGLAAGITAVFSAFSSAAAKTDAPAIATPRERAAANLNPEGPNWGERLRAMLPNVLDVGVALNRWAEVTREYVIVAVPQAMHVISEGAASLFRGTGDAIMAGLRVVSDSAAALFRGASNAVMAGLTSVSGAIIAWISGLPAAVAGAVKSLITPTITPPTAADRNFVQPTGPGAPRGFPGRGGFGAGVQQESYTPPANNNRPIHATVINYMDGREIGRHTAKVWGDEMSGPSRGTTGFDYRETPSYPGNATVAI